MSPVITLRNASPANGQCAHCHSITQCWPASNRAEPAFRFARRRVKRGQSLYRMGDTFHGLYSVRSGTFKSRTLLEDGRDQVTGLHLNGDLLGFDGIGSGQFQSDCTALEDSEVCVLPFDQVLALSRSQPGMMADLLSAMSKEIAREQNQMALLGSMHSGERVVAFLLSVSERMHTRGYSATCFVLLMTREELGSYLGLKLETVSRVLSRLQAAGLIKIECSRQITLLDIDAMRAFSADELFSSKRVQRTARKPLPAVRETARRIPFPPVRALAQRSAAS